MDKFRNVICERCGMDMRPGSLRRHQTTPYCTSVYNRRQRESDPDWTTWRSTNLKWQEQLALIQKTTGINFQKVMTHYRRPAWGNPANKRFTSYVRAVFKPILDSSLFTFEEKLVLLNTPHDAPEFQAAYVAASLAEEKHE